jgi:hypothetical protein
MVALRTGGTSSKSGVSLAVSLALAGGLILVCRQAGFADIPSSPKRVLLLHHYGPATCRRLSSLIRVSTKYCAQHYREASRSIARLLRVTVSLVKPTSSWSATI